VALVGKADFLCDQGQRLIGAAHQSFRPLDSPVHHVALWPDTDRLLEAATEVEWTETRHRRKIGQCQAIIEMASRCSHTRASAARATIRSTARRRPLSDRRRVA
jgi:hypothetical protein